VIASGDVTYDVIFLVHLVVAVAVAVVLITLRVTANGVTVDSDRDQLRKRFPDRVDWAARLVHVLPITGIVLSLIGDSGVALRQPWIITGIFLYLVLAFWLEARALPAERVLARSITTSVDAVPAAARKLTRELDHALLLLALVFVTMIVQF
jgi:uncharacterized membrane protein